ncbi:MAG: hypothetical protein L0287_11030 [Anaerolineae bacterium]|nr:hypothetical protein [Anaerolineae bacterium]MCI0609254.1 hypothetical protein [Anaerolineae bacterium]
MPTKSSADLIYTVIKESLSAQQVQKNTLETKASTLTGFAGAMIALLIGAKTEILSLPSAAKLMVIVSVFLFSLSILFATIVGWVRKYRTDPNPQALAENYLTEAESKVKLQLIANHLGTWKNNSRQLYFERSQIAVLRVSRILKI